MEGPLEFSIVDTCDRESDKNNAFTKTFMQGKDHEPSDKGKSKSTAENKDGPSIVQRRRKTLSIHQKRALEMKFALSPYVSMKQQEELTVELGMTKREVQFWFKNKRYRVKRKTLEKAASQVTQLNELEVDYDNLAAQCTPPQPMLPMSYYNMGPAPDFYHDDFLW